MGLLDLAFHILGFLAPAPAVAIGVAAASRVLAPGRASASRWWVSVAINSIVGAAVLAAGLWHFGVDGKMVTYGALVLTIASGEWLLGRGWTR